MSGKHQITKRPCPDSSAEGEGADRSVSAGRGTLACMTAPALAHQTPYGRMYSRAVNEAPEVPSITTVIGLQAIDLTGWAGYMAAQAVIQDPRLPEAIGNKAKLGHIARTAADAAGAYRDAAAARGDRVHFYAEQVALRSLGKPHTMPKARESLAEFGEDGFADRFDEWWEQYQVRPMAAEVTVWNHSVGYAGTIDLVAEIGGKVCLIDFKTKGTDRQGRIKMPDEKVAMQLVAGLKAEESIVDHASGLWEPWPYGEADMLMAVALGEREVLPLLISPETWKENWFKFWALRKLWEYDRATSNHIRTLLPISPPPQR